MTVLGLMGEASHSDAETAAAHPAPPSHGEINSTLDALARRLAGASDDVRLRRTIHNGVGKRFDGDEEALLSSLAADAHFATKVAGSRDMAAKIPRLQVAVPVHFDKWDPVAYAPLVAYFPQGVDDTKVSKISAYDAAGNAVLLDAQVAPERPVIMLGLNERTNGRGDLLPTTTSGDIQNVAQAVTNVARTSYSVDVRMVHLIEDKEPWALGDAEISMKAKSRGCSGTNYQASNWENLNNNDDWWAPGGVRNMGRTTCDVVFYWWEDDGGAWDFTLTYDGFGLGVGMDNDDDMIGGKQLPYSSFAGGGTSTWRKDEWPALAQWTE